MLEAPRTTVGEKVVGGGGDGDDGGTGTAGPGLRGPRGSLREGETIPRGKTGMRYGIHPFLNKERGKKERVRNRRERETEKEGDPRETHRDKTRRTIGENYPGAAPEGTPVAVVVAVVATAAAAAAAAAATLVVAR